MENPVSLDRKQISCSGEFTWKELNELTVYTGASRTEWVKDDGEAPNNWQEGRAITPPDLKEQREDTECLEPKQRRGGMAFPRWLSGKEPTCQRTGRGFSPWVRKISWRRKWRPSPVFLPGKFRGQRSLVGYSPRGHRVRQDWVTEHGHTSRNRAVEERLTRRGSCPGGWQMLVGQAVGQTYWPLLISMLSCQIACHWTNLTGTKGQKSRKLRIDFSKEFII